MFLIVQKCKFTFLELMFLENTQIPWKIPVNRIHALIKLFLLYSKVFMNISFKLAALCDSLCMAKIVFYQVVQILWGNWLHCKEKQR